MTEGQIMLKENHKRLDADASRFGFASKKADQLLQGPLVMIHASFVTAILVGFVGFMIGKDSDGSDHLPIECSMNKLSDAQKDAFHYTVPIVKERRANLLP